MTNWDEFDVLPPVDIVSGPTDIEPKGPCGVVAASTFRYGSSMTIDVFRVYLDKRNWQCFVGEDQTYPRHIHLRTLYSTRVKKGLVQHRFDLCIDPDTAAELAKALWSYSSKVVGERVIQEVLDGAVVKED